MTRLLNSLNRAKKILNVYKSGKGKWPHEEIENILTIYINTIIQKNIIGDRLLRAMKDIYVVSYRNFEGTDLHKEIDTIDEELRKFYSNYQYLEPLGMDFGKSDPI